MISKESFQNFYCEKEYCVFCQVPLVSKYKYYNHVHMYY